VLAALLAVTIGACSAGNTTRGPSSPSPSVSETGVVVALGHRAKTSKGGSVIVYVYEKKVSTTAATPDPGNRFVAFDVEGCAGPNADARTGIQPELFYLQVDQLSYHPVVPGVRQPALHQTALAPGGCARGWVTFQVPTGSKPRYIFFRSSPRAVWQLPL
jgi:hypothetical protein